jgi:hypothetical protein
MNEVLCGTEDTISESKVDERVDRTRRALSKKEI